MAECPRCRKQVTGAHTCLPAGAAPPERAAPTALQYRALTVEQMAAEMEAALPGLRATIAALEEAKKLPPGIMDMEVRARAPVAPSAAGAWCDCGAPLSVCADCAVADYQAAHTDCATCSPGVPPCARAPSAAPTGEEREMAIDRPAEGHSWKPSPEAIAGALRAYDTATREGLVVHLRIRAALVAA
jgi:hypothetical protein